MARRSTLDRGPQSDVHDGGSDVHAPQSGQDGGSPVPWRGSGGRWAVWAARALIWAVLIVIGIRGVIAIVLGQTTPVKSTPSTTPSASSSTGFPSSLAEAYALQFGSVYLNFSQSGAAQRAQQLANFLPPGTDSRFGWNQAGSLTLQSDQVAGIQISDAQHAVVTLLARVNDHLMELGVPIYAAGGGMTVSGEPAWLGAPASAIPPKTPAKNPDAAAQSALSAQLPAFFQAYASGNAATLARFLAPGASVTGLSGAVTYSSISSLYVPTGGDTRQITVTVVWQIPSQAGAASARLQMTYDLTVVSQNANWYVQNIRAAAQPTGQQS